MKEITFGFIVDEPDTLSLHSDTTLRMISECNKRSIRVLITTPNGLFLKNGTLYAEWLLSSFCDGNSVSDSLQYYGVHTVDESCNLLLMRKDPPVDSTYIITNQMLRFTSVQVINDPTFLINRNEKMLALQSPYRIPESIVTMDVNLILRTLKQNTGKMVIKPLNDRAGYGVSIISNDDYDYSHEIVNTVTKYGRYPVIIQPYLKEVSDGDKRVFMLDGTPLAWMNRIPRENDFRANIHLGATPSLCDLTERDKEICAWINTVISSKEVPMLGVDIIGDYLSEINFTSPSGIPEINRLTSKEYEKDIITACINRVN